MSVIDTPQSIIEICFENGIYLKKNMLSARALMLIFIYERQDHVSFYVQNLRRIVFLYAVDRSGDS